MTGDPDDDRAFLRDVLKLTNVDLGDGWLIFGLPPAELAVHPSNENDVHEFYFSRGYPSYHRCEAKENKSCI